MKIPALLLLGFQCAAPVLASELPAEMPVWKNGTLQKSFPPEKPETVEFASISDLLATADEVRVFQGFGATRKEFRAKGIALPLRFSMAFAQMRASPSGLCLCVGNPKVEFYLKGSLLATFSIHHGQSIDYSAGKYFGAFTLGASSVQSLLKTIAEVPFYKTGE